MASLSTEPRRLGLEANTLEPIQTSSTCSEKTPKHNNLQLHKRLLYILNVAVEG